MAHELKRCWSEITSNGPWHRFQPPTELELLRPSEISRYQALFHISLFATHNIFPWNSAFRRTTLKHRLPIPAITNLAAHFWVDRPQKIFEYKVAIDLVDPVEPGLGLNLREFVVWTYIYVNWQKSGLPISLPNKIRRYLLRSTLYDNIPVKLDRRDTPVELDGRDMPVELDGKAQPKTEQKNDSKMTDVAPMP